MINVRVIKKLKMCRHYICTHDLLCIRIVSTVSDVTAKYPKDALSICHLTLRSANSCSEQSSTMRWVWRSGHNHWPERLLPILNHYKTTKHTFLLTTPQNDSCPPFTSPLHLRLLCHCNILYVISMGPEWTRWLGNRWVEGFEWTDLQTSQTPINDEPVMVRVLRLHCHTRWMNYQLETILKCGHISCNAQHEFTFWPKTTQNSLLHYYMTTQNS